MTPTTIPFDLLRHMAWADASVWNTVAACEAARSDANLRDRLFHLHVVQQAFLRAWRGEPRDAPYPTFTDTLALGSWARTYYGAAFAHLSSLTDAQASQPMPLPWAEHVAKRLGRVPVTTTVAETMLQVALHSTYHRGQVNTRIREVGGEPAVVDYIAWVWFGRPEAAWTWPELPPVLPASRA
jgi:uncharacterized damage-inducible protein DinB